MRTAHRRLVGDACKTLAGIVVYAGVIGAFAFAALYFVPAWAELKCSLCNLQETVTFGAKPADWLESASEPALRGRVSTH